MIFSGEFSQIILNGMLDNIIELVKTQVLNSVTNGGVEIPADKKESIVDTTTDSLVDTLKSNFSLDNIGALTSLFGGGSKSSSNVLVDTLQSSVVSALSQKVGLSKDMSSMIASLAIPAVMNMFQDKINDPKDSSFSIESLIKAFSGSKGGGLLGALGSLFGK